MKRNLYLFLCFVLLVYSGCKGRDRYIRTKNDTKFYFRSAILIQRGFWWDSTSGDVDLYTDNGPIKISRDFDSIDAIYIGEPERESNRSFLKVDVSFRSGRFIVGYLELHPNRGWDYVEVTTKHGTEQIPLIEIDAIRFR